MKHILTFALAFSLVGASFAADGGEKGRKNSSNNAKLQTNVHKRVPSPIVKNEQQRLIFHGVERTEQAPHERVQSPILKNEQRSVLAERTAAPTEKFERKPSPLVKNARPWR